MGKPLIDSKETRPAECVITRVRLAAPPAAVWKTLMFFEDVPRGSWSIFRLLLPRPLRSEGDKTTVGSLVRCVYERGHLIKRITAVEPEHRLGFEVVEQQLGIESAFRAWEGSYDLSEDADGTELSLTTLYTGTLWPRSWWRPIERYFGHRFHHYVLRGMREALDSENRLGRSKAGARGPARSVAVLRR